MTTNDTYLAVFLGSKTSARSKAWMALPEAERRAKEQEGMAAWKAWVAQHQAAVSAMGGPLGKTKKVSEGGIEDVSNAMGAFVVVRADSHEAAARLFEKHPHFTIFPGRSRGDHAGLARSQAVDRQHQPVIFAPPVPTWRCASPKWRSAIRKGP